MLVLNLQDHPVERYQERAGNYVRDLLEIIAEINLSLPDGWRMTRSENNFSILVVPISGISFVLKGYSFRYEGDKILHVIDTIFEPCYFDRDDVSALGIPKDSYVNRAVIRDNPDIVVPNLYFFKPCPDDSTSPLFARQYEKVKHNESNGALTETQYHRIHPLSKWGLDMDHYKWIEWNINGKVEFVEYPNTLYHGKDYWEIPALNKVRRNHDAKAYVNHLLQLMAQYNILVPEPPEQPQTPFEQEFKLMVQEQAGEPDIIFPKVKNILKSLGYEGLDSSVVKEQVDYYFDDQSFNLYNNGASFRFRETKGSARVTLKVRPHNTKPQSAGEYRRIEEESTISVSQKDALFRGEKITALPFRLLPYVAPDCGKLKHVVTVMTQREILEVKNKYLQKAELCFDITHYKIDGKTLGPDVEIEIESKGLPRNDIGAVASLLEEELKLTPSPKSKYERAVECFSLIS